MAGTLRRLWDMLDERLVRLSKGLQRLVRLLRITRALLWLGIVMVLASAVVGIVWPQYFAYAYAIAVLVLSLPLVMLAMLVGLPLRMKSVVRLIDMGYPANARELFIRFLARKLRDESIATEELLFETAWNEGKKLWRKVESRRAEQGAGDAQGQDDAYEDGDDADDEASTHRTGPAPGPGPSTPP